MPPSPGNRHGSVQRLCRFKSGGQVLRRTWTTDLKSRKIRVNAISPGVVPTEGYRSLGDEEGIKKFTEQMATQIPLGRVGEPDEIAKRWSSSPRMPAASSPARSWLSTAA